MLRRNFIRLSAMTFAATLFSRLTYAGMNGETFINSPDEAWAKAGDQWFKLLKSGNSFIYKDISARLIPVGNAQEVQIESPESEIQCLKFSWKYRLPGNTKVLGDHWERSYGDLAWKKPEAALKNPWYMLLSDDSHTACFGVKTNPDTICWWSVMDDSVELSMDTQSGGMGVKLGSRTLKAAQIITSISTGNENAYATATRFCKMMCPKPRLPKQPVYGINDWYVVYGKNSYETIRQQTSFMAQFISDTNNKPFSVIDDGWQQEDDFSLVNAKFKDMQKMGQEIKNLGMRPGLWTRPLIARKDDKKSLLAPKIAGRDQSGQLILDPTLPETLSRVKRNISLYNQWGYEMVKHDFSSWDIFGRWGFQMEDNLTAPGWKFNDQSRTNAEIIKELYQTIRVAAKDMYIIGCNTLSHLSAGLFELNRTGDDTSGKEWARTRKMGVNTLGFRLPQHNTFYAADGDCVGLTKDVPWEKNRQWLQLLAESGSPLFVSTELDIMGTAQKEAVKLAFSQAANVQPTGEPLDWMNSQWPSRWKLNNRIVDFDWS